MNEQKTLGFICLIFSLFLVSQNCLAQDQNNPQPEQRQRGIQYVEPTVHQTKDIKFFEGMAVGVDVVGAVMYKLAYYGQLEGQLRINLKETYFPVAELGIGHSDHTDEETLLHFKTNSPYIRVGCDMNFNKDKKSKNRIYCGLRYAFTSCKFDLSGIDQVDPVWKTVVPFSYKGMNTTASWIELVFGLEAKIYKTFHIGWSARYKMRISQSTPELGEAWYLPGFGKNDTHNFGATFNLIFDI